MTKLGCLLIAYSYPSKRLLALRRPGHTKCGAQASVIADHLFHSHQSYCRTFINANSLSVKFDNCKENYWTQIGTHVNQWVLIANLITAIANEFRQTNY